MPRRKKVPLKKGKQRLVTTRSGEMKIEHTLYCGECGKPTQSARIRRNAKAAKRDGLLVDEEVARACMNFEKHRDGKKHFWPVRGVVIPVY